MLRGKFNIYRVAARIIIPGIHAYVLSFREVNRISIGSAYMRFTRDTPETTNQFLFDYARDISSNSIRKQRKRKKKRDYKMVTFSY